ncbi:hypothetical protein CR513_12895, partial [Mucuna pruriens]
MRIETQQRICLASRRTYLITLNNWRSKEREKERPRREKSPKKRSILPLGRNKEGKLPNPVPTSKSSSIKCFKFLGKGHITSHCLNKRSIVMTENGIIWIVLAPHLSKLCSVIGSSVNVASTRQVEKLKLPTLAHPKPYKL